MRAFLRTISLGGFTALWLSRLCSPAYATYNVTSLGSGPTTPSPPYSLQDPAIRPSSPRYHGPSPPSDLRSNVGVPAPPSDPATSLNFAITGPGNQQVFNRHSWISRVQKPRARVTAEKKLVSKYRRLHGIERTCDHKRWNKPCVCGVPPEVLKDLLQNLVPKPFEGLANITDATNATSGSTNIEVFQSGPEDFLPALHSSSSGSPPWPNSSQAILAGTMAVNMGPFDSEQSVARMDHTGCSAEESIENAQAQPITRERLTEEFRGIYAGLVMVERKCIEIDEKLCRDPKRLSDEQWQALIALHRTLLHEHHDFFLASQHPSSSAGVTRLTVKYSMPARRWRHAIHTLLEVLRHRLPDSLDHMESFIDVAYSLLASQVEAEPSAKEWMEILGDLARYRLAIEEVGVRDREVWVGCAQKWYNQAADRSPDFSRLQQHLAVLARPNTSEEYLATPTRPTITRRSQQNGAERQLTEEFPARRPTCAQYHPPQSPQGQFDDGDEEMLRMRPILEANASIIDKLPSAFQSCVPEDIGTNDALNESVDFIGIGDVLLGETIPDTDMQDFNFDDFLLPEIPESPSVNPLNDLFNPDMIFSMDVEEPNTGLPLEDHYLVQESDWNIEFDVHMMHEVPESRPAVELNPTFPVTVDGKPNDDDQAEAGSPASWNSNKPEDQGISSTDTLIAKPDKNHSLQKDTKTNGNISDAPDQESRSLPTQTDVLLADTADPTHIRGDRMKPEGIFLLLLIQPQRGSPNSLRTTRGGGAVLTALQVVLVYLAIILRSTQRLW